MNTVLLKTNMSAGLASLFVLGVVACTGGCAADTTGAGESGAQTSQADSVMWFSCDTTAPDQTGTYDETNPAMQSWTLYPSNNLCGMNVLELDNPDEAPGTVSVNVPEFGPALGATTFAVYGGVRVSATDYQWETISASHAVKVKGCPFPHARVCHIVLDNTASFHSGYDKIRVAAVSTFTFGVPGDFKTEPEPTNIHIAP